MINHILNKKEIILKIELHVCRGNQWDPATSSPIFAMNSVGTSFVLPAAILGGGETEDKVKWHHAFARKGFHVLDAVMKKGQSNNVNNRKTTVFYYEVRIMAPHQLDSSDLRYRFSVYLTTSSIIKTPNRSKDHQIAAGSLDTF
jgi:hypothetical protein